MPYPEIQRIFRLHALDEKVCPRKGLFLGAARPACHSLPELFFCAHQEHLNRVLALGVANISAEVLQRTVVAGRAGHRQRRSPIR